MGSPIRSLVNMGKTAGLSKMHRQITMFDAGYDLSGVCVRLIKVGVGVGVRDQTHGLQQVGMEVVQC